MLSQRVPFDRKHENDRAAFRKIDITAKGSADPEEAHKALG